MATETIKMTRNKANPRATAKQRNTKLSVVSETPNLDSLISNVINEVDQRTHYIFPNAEPKVYLTGAPTPSMTNSTSGSHFLVQTVSISVDAVNNQLRIQTKENNRITPWGLWDEVKKIIQTYTELTAEKFAEILKQVKDSKASNPTTEVLILRYLMNGSCKDRFGNTIEKPEGELKDEYLSIGLHLLKIALQRKIDKIHDFEWLADASKLNKKQRTHKFWEGNAAKLAEPVAGAAISIGVTTAKGFLGEDDYKKILSLIAGVLAAKAAEKVLRDQIDKDKSETWYKWMKNLEEKKA